MKRPHILTASAAAVFSIILLGSAMTGCGGSGGDDGVQAQESPVDYEQRLVDLGIELRPPAPPVANFVHSVRTGNLVFLAGHGPQRADGSWVTGKIGKDMTIEEGRDAARLTAINLLSTLKAEIGNLNRVKRIVKVHGMVNSTDTFTDQPKVMNGCSDLLVEVFGDRGRHARAAVGMMQLPFGIPVEIEMVVEVE